MRITVLTDLERKDPSSYDKVVDQVVEALRQGGHEAEVLGVHRDLRALIDGLTKPKPELVFNLFENFGKVRLGAVGVVGLLDLLEVPYVGGGPGESFIQQDKAITKKLLAFDDIRYPDFAVFSRDSDLETGGNLRMPLFVKPVSMDASIGIEFSAVVGSIKELMERIDALHADLDSPVLVEEYIEGRELYVAVLGNETPTALPVIELDLSDLPEGTPKIAGTEVKWERGTEAYKKTKLRIPEDLKEETVAELQDVAVRAYRALEIRDYGRVDMRLTNDGKIYILEVNPNPWLHTTAEFALAAKQAGRDYPTLIEEIVNVAVARYRGRAMPVRS